MNEELGFELGLGVGRRILICSVLNLLLRLHSGLSIFYTLLAYLPRDRTPVPRQLVALPPETPDRPDGRPQWNHPDDHEPRSGFERSCFVPSSES